MKINRLKEAVLKVLAFIGVEIALVLLVKWILGIPNTIESFIFVASVSAIFALYLVFSKQ